MKLFFWAVAILIALLFAPGVLAQDSFTEGSETHCIAGSCTLTLYGGLKFVYEDNQWKRVEDARSLFGKYEIIYLQKDSNHDFRVIDYNYTSITLEAFITDGKESEKSTPIKVDGIHERTIIFSGISDKRIITLRSDEPILDKNYTIGSTSTTIILNSAGLNLLDNGYVLSNLADSTAGFDQTIDSVNARSSSIHRLLVKFNVTQIPTGQVIDEAILGYRMTTQNGEINISAYWIKDSNWTEDVTTWNNQPCGTDFNDVDNCDVTNTSPLFFSGGSINNYRNWTVTNQLQDAYDESHINFSITLKATREDYSSGSHNGAFSNTRFGSNFPNLTITYSVAAAGERANASIILPADGTVFTAPAPRINVSTNYTQNDSDGDSITFYLYFDGEFNRTITTNSTLNFTEGSHNLTVNAHDGTSWGVNDTVLFSFVCISAWECTAWVNNGTSDYRSCTDSSMCVFPSNEQQTERPAREHLALFVIMLGVGLALIFIGAQWNEPLSVAAGSVLVLIDAFMILTDSIVLSSRFNDFGIGLIMIFISLYVFYRIAIGEDL